MDVPGRRLFVAVPVPPEASSAIARFVEGIRAEDIPRGGRDVRWVRLDGLHLTLRFIGPVAPERVDAVAQAVAEAATGLATFDVEIGEGGSFPPSGRPRALWLGLRRGAVELANAAAAVDRALAARGWPTDDRPYRAHLTLARSDGVAAGAAIAARLVEGAAGLSVPFRATSIALFESVTGGGPARYLPLEVVPLA